MKGMKLIILNTSKAKTMKQTTKEKPEITLKSEQKPHFERCCEILSKNHCYGDVSQMGLGKTYNVGAIVARFCVPYIVFGTKSTKIAWDDMYRDYKTSEYLGFMTYAALAGKADKILSHNYLTRTSVQVGDKVEPKYTATDDWRRLCEQGVMVIFDEAHRLKNDNLFNRAATELVREIKKSQCSRYALLTATKCDGEGHYVNFCNLMCIFRKPVYTSSSCSKSLIDDAIDDIIRYCRSYDEKKTNKILMSESALIADKRYLINISQKLFQGVIKGRLFSGIPDTIERRSFRGFFDITLEQDKKTVEEGTRELVAHTGYNKEDNSIVSASLDSIVASLRKIESGEVNDFIRLADSWLVEDKLSKVILCFNYLDSVQRAYDILSRRYTCVVMVGDTKNRDVVISTFNTNDNVRVLIMTTQTAGESVDLHDKVGGRRRRMYISPTYITYIMHQAAGRIARLDQASVGEAYIFYPKSEYYISPILRAIEPKSKQLSMSLTEYNQGTLFPGDYPRYVEGYGFVDEEKIDPFYNDILEFMNVLEAGYSDEIPFKKREEKTHSTIIQDIPVSNEPLNPLRGLVGFSDSESDSDSESKSDSDSESESDEDAFVDDEPPPPEKPSRPQPAKVITIKRDTGKVSIQRVTPAPSSSKKTATPSTQPAKVITIKRPPEKPSIQRVTPAPTSSKKGDTPSKQTSRSTQDESCEVKSPIPSLPLPRSRTVRRSPQAK